MTIDVATPASGYFNVANLEKERQAILQATPARTLNDLTVQPENMKYLDPIARDAEFIAELQEQDTAYGIGAVCSRRLEELGHAREASAPNSRGRSYDDTPNVDAYAIEPPELERLARASHALTAEVMHAVPVGLWHYAKCDTTCVFCYEQLMGPCSKCLSNATSAAECKIALGECGHPVHSDCQKSWRGSNCMTCQRPWILKAEHSVLGPGVSF